MPDNKTTADGQIPCITPRIDCEDAASLILFIDTFIPYLDMADQDSRDSAVNVFRVREKMHMALGDLGADIPVGVSPL